jgi:hypothetical protein
VLAGNGLASPLCANPGLLSATARRDCETADFSAAPDPTGDYDFDVNINTGATRWGNDIAATIQDFLQFAWMSLVALTHSLIVMFEWCYSLNLLSGSLLSQITSALHGARLTFTEPWLAMALSIAAALALYHGLIRREVSRTLGQAVAMLMMMVGGLWLIADPAGTVGTLEQWADQAGMGTLAAVAAGSPSHPAQTMVARMQDLFSAVVTGPWCYLEFGNVRWCEDPGELDSRLRTAAAAIAESEQKQSHCGAGCGPAASAWARSLATSAELLRGASTNGELFLALPADELQRNSVTTEGALLNVLCGAGESADRCRGPTAPQAEFRTEKGTNSRVMGLLIIWAGSLGMLLLFGSLALRLLGAALGCLFYLLLAPAAVIAPALGDGGRAVFRGWTMRLLEAVVAKLTYSFLLGAALMTMHVLLSLTVLGWMAQWLLISAFWWGAFMKRHQTLGLVHGEGRGMAGDRPRSLAQRVERTLQTPRAMVHAARASKRALSRPGTAVERRRKRAQAGRERARREGDEQVAGMLEREHEVARMRVASASRAQARLSERQGKLERVRRERERATEAGDHRRAASLGVRQQRIETELAHGQRALGEARRTVAEGDKAKRHGGSPYTEAQRQQRARFLDEQAALPAAARRRPSEQRRDYAALAGLADHGREQYESLDARAQRRVRLQIDRELARRSQLTAAARDVAQAASPGPGRREQRKVDREFDNALSERMRASGHALRPSVKPTPVDAYLRQSPKARERTRAHSSSVMRDALEVQARRKRQLGTERPLGRERPR